MEIINFKTDDKGACITPCPYRNDIFVGSSKCISKCSYSTGINSGVSICCDYTSEVPYNESRLFVNMFLNAAIEHLQKTDIEQKRLSRIVYTIDEAIKLFINDSDIIVFEGKIYEPIEEIEAQLCTGCDLKNLDQWSYACKPGQGVKCKESEIIYKRRDQKH